MSDKTLIVCAMQEEAKPLIDQYAMKAINENTIYVNDDKSLYLYVVGIGKDNAIASMMGNEKLYDVPKIDEYKEVINFGTAGCSGGYKVPDIVEVKRFYDADFTADNLSIPQYDPSRVNDTKEGLAVFTGSVFATSVNENIKRFNNGENYLFEMECYIFASMCKKLSIPFRAVKVVSDNLTADGMMSFDKLLDKLQNDTDFQKEIANVIGH